MESNSEPRVVLLADGDERTARYITRCLRASEYRVLFVNTLDQLLVVEAKVQPSVVLLDADTAWAVGAVPQIREGSEVPIVVMSQSNEPLVAAALAAGANAVLMKPFTSELLVAYITSLIKRVQVHPGQELEENYKFNDLSVDFGARAVTRHGIRIHLSVREFRLLQVLATNGGRVLTHDQLLRLVWGPGYEESGDLLRGYIRNLRRKLEDNARHPDLVHTESQVGYWMPRSES